ncbi:MAG TPA: hypothetical protein VGH13_01190 [Xanthobacteraceae bacterium]
MSAQALWYSFRSELPPGCVSPDVIGGKLVQTLDALTGIDPTTFFGWEVMDYPANDSIPLETARSRIAAIAKKNVARDNDELRADGGYTVGAFTGSSDKSRRFSLRISSGGKNIGELSLSPTLYENVPDLGMVSYPTYRTVLLSLNAIWPPTWACAYVYRAGYYEAPLYAGASLFPYSRFHIPWLAYVSSPLAAGLRLAPEILTERTADGGLLMIAAEERLDPSNPEHLRRARILAETMMACTGHGATSLEDMARAQVIGEAVMARAYRRR